MIDSSYASWVGKQRQTDAILASWPAQALEAVLETGACTVKTELPGLWHWLYFLETATRSRIGHDGHPVKGDFLPPVANPRRMFAGARTQYLRPLIISERTCLLETVVNVQDKQRAQGDMTIVTVQYQYLQGDSLCVQEERDFIYLPAVEAGAPSAPIQHQLTAVEPARWSMDIPTDPVLLMRFSALTFNSHRIHYDVDYARQREGYPGLVVHGPLSAILLAELCRLNSDQAVTSFSFRALNPVFVGQTLRLRGEPGDDGSAELIAYTPAGKPALQASVCFAQDP